MLLFHMRQPSPPTLHWPVEQRVSTEYILRYPEGESDANALVDDIPCQAAIPQIQIEIIEAHQIGG